ncbi:11132_t:CDS:1, partial [Entrophospora sp. SA101]
MNEQTFNDQEINDYYQENFNSMNLDYFASQVFGDAQLEITDTSISVTSLTSSSTSNPLWQHFNRDPSDAQGYN